MVCMGADAAQAARIQDLSMTPNEMIQQNMNVNHAGKPLPGPNLSPTMPGGQDRWGNDLPVTGTPDNAPSGNYMTGYCDPNFKPMMARSAAYAGMAACLQKQRDEACQLYQAAANDVRRMIDESVNCMAAGMEGDTMGDDEDSDFAPTRSAMPTGCGAVDSKRLSMVKRYWNDQNTAYALVFVPDLVMDNSGSCLKKR